MKNSKINLTSNMYFKTIYLQIQNYLVKDSKKHFQAKIVNICTESLISHLVSQYIREFSSVSNEFKFQNITIVNSYIKFVSRDNLLKIKPKLYMQEFLKLVYQIILICFSIFSLKSESEKKSYLAVYSLTPEQIINNSGVNCSKFFETFYKEYRNHKILIEFNSINHRRLNEKFTFRNSSFLIRAHKHNIRFKLVVQFLRSIHLIVLHIIRNPMFIVGANKFLEGSVVSLVIHEKKIDYYQVCTQSQLCSPPSLFYFIDQTRNWMLWYSDNSLPIKTKKQEDVKYDLSYLQTRHIGLHFVWSNTFAEILNKYNKSKIKLVLPFSFFKSYPLPRTLKIESSSTGKSISFFPITPISQTKNHNIFSEKNLTRDLDLIIKVINDLNIQNNILKLSVKLKRKPGSQHSNSYLDKISKFQQANMLSLLEYDTDLIKVLNESSLVICSPFTSVALIAKYLKINTIYFSSSIDGKMFSKYEGIPIITSETKLRKYIQNA